jgi:hypothetical protein
MFCPKCRSEYREGFTRCATCDLQLVESVPTLRPASSRPLAADVTYLGYALPIVFGLLFLFFAWTLRKGPPRVFLWVPFLFLILVSVSGSCWVLYQSIRYEIEPIRQALLAFVPFSFFRYYQSRVLPRPPVPLTPLPDQPGNQTNFLSYLIPIAACYAVMLAQFIFPKAPEIPFLIVLGVLSVVVGNLGSYWMLYKAIRYEDKPLLFALLAFVQFAFIWYFVARYRAGRVNREPIALRIAEQNSEQSLDARLRNREAG